MLFRTYRHGKAGAVAAPVFAVAGAAVGWVVGASFRGAPQPAVSALLWAVVSGLVAFLVFATEGPRRPPSVTQAAVADGVVAGILAGVLGGVLTALTISAAGSSSSSGFSLPGLLLAVAGGTVLGAAAGAALGWVVLLLGGEERLARPSGSRPAGAKRAQKGRGKQPKARR